MCGIVGVFSVKEGWSVSENELKVMRDQMVSRGPDDAGIFTHQEAGLFVGLGHRRLSIIDLSPLGHQPMSTFDHSYWIVFNGEIFNYQELREELSRTGRYLFNSKSDTEVLLYGIREWGLDGCLKRLRGMYAFALFDKVKGSLTLVRDPLGVKPLYYFYQPGMIAFASEIKALLALPGFKKSVDDLAFYHYLTFSNSPAPQTLFEGISKLEAGTSLKINRSGSIRHARYWNPARFVTEERPVDEQVCVEELRGLLRQSVSRRMVSDVPFGVFLSGGLDSSLNAALMAEQMVQPVETFSVGIKGDSSNEFEFARKVAQRFGTRHREILIDDDEFISFLPEMPFFQDEPLADPVCVPLYYLSKLARESGTTVIQVGEGSDELFAGYEIYHRFNHWNKKIYQPYLKTPAFIRSFLYRMAGGHVSAEKEDALRRAREGSPLFMGNAIAFWDSEKGRLLKKPFLKDSSSRYIEGLTRSLPISDPLLSIINVELKNRLPELLLMRVDKMSMANSIEIRVPFLDEDLVEFALTLPSSLKFKNGETKYLLKKAAEGILPDEIIYRKKWGFCGSATNMLSEKLVSYALRRIMESPLIAERFNREYIECLFKNHQEQKRFNSFKIWNLLNLVLWHSRWFE
ncbi:MAG: asparagine synthase (glutamine-hydrolyzing) [Nitrospiria bacterium]